jgi:hypothetical protein
MTQRSPCTTLVELAGVGHAPTLVAQDQTERVVDCGPKPPLIFD